MQDLDMLDAEIVGLPMASPRGGAGGGGAAPGPRPAPAGPAPTPAGPVLSPRGFATPRSVSPGGGGDFVHASTNPGRSFSGRRFQVGPAPASSGPVVVVTPAAGPVPGDLSFAAAMNPGAQRSSAQSGPGSYPAGSPQPPPPTPPAAPVARVTIQPPSGPVTAGTTQPLFAQAFDAAGTLVTPLAPPAWTASTGGFIDPAGNFGANTPGMYQVTAVVDGISATTSVMVQPDMSQQAPPPPPSGGDQGTAPADSGPDDSYQDSGSGYEDQGPADYAADSGSDDDSPRLYAGDEAEDEGDSGAYEGEDEDPMEDLDMLDAEMVGEAAFGDNMVAQWKADQAAAPAQPAPAPVPAAIASGNRDENALTDLEFFARHPERGGARIEKGDKALAKEWIQIRDDVVRPALLRAGTPVRAPGVSAPAPVPGSNAAVAVQVAADNKRNQLIGAGLGLLALLGIGTAWATH